MLIVTFVVAERFGQHATLCLIDALQMVIRIYYSIYARIDFSVQIVVKVQEVNRNGFSMSSGIEGLLSENVCTEVFISEKAVVAKEEVSS